MNENDSIFKKNLEQGRVSRRNLIRGATGAAGAGLLLGSGLRSPVLANGDDEGERRNCRTLPRPLPHITTPPGQHFNFPGPVTSGDPSTVTDFQGTIGQADLFFAGTGTDLHSGESAPYGFHTDWRFMSGEFIGVDGRQHKGTLSFI